MKDVTSSSTTVICSPHLFIEHDHTYAAKREPKGNHKTCTSSFVFWNICGKQRFSRSIDNSECFLSEIDIVFLCETWILNDPTPLLAGKDFFNSSAMPTGGRPSGGLEMYISPSLEGSLVSKTHHHICVKTPRLYIVGVYYKPSLDLDDIVCDLTVALTACTDPSLDIVIGGDFNLHSQSFDFEVLAQLLSSHDISLTSDPAINTFLNSQGTSTPDYIFSSSSLKTTGVSVPQRIESDHFPLLLSATVPIDPPPTPVPRTSLDFNRCIDKLESLSTTCSVKTPEELASELHEILTESQVEFKPKTQTLNSRISVLRSETQEALHSYHRSRSLFFKTVYLNCRRNLHREIALHKRQQREMTVHNLISHTQRDGIRALYKTAKPNRPNLSPHVPLHKWFSYCSDLYQTFDEPDFHKIPVVPTEAATKLMNPITAAEITQVLNNQHSLAKGSNGLSPVDLKRISNAITPILIPIFNSILLESSPFPKPWLSTLFFFLHKKGSLEDPAHYRSLAVEDPIFKVFTSILHARLMEYCELQQILPSFQFGFRKNLSTTSATMLLKHSIETSLQSKKRVYACFVDFKKAFDLIDRTALCERLQLLGIPTSLSKVIFDLLHDLQFHVKSNSSISPPFSSNNGVPQGDPLSPLLFSLFIADLPSLTTHKGIKINPNTEIQYLLYADDLVLLSHDPGELQTALDKLYHYCLKSKISVSLEKTKCLTFYKGSCPRTTFLYNGQPLENCNHFTYLGVVFTTQLSASKHVDHILAKCNAKLGILHAKLPLKSLPLSVYLDIFNIYILPIITYSLPVWLPKLTAGAANRLNSMFTKYLKLYLGLPYCSNNAIVHHLTCTSPLTYTLNTLAEKSFLKVRYPPKIDGTHFTPPPPVPAQPYTPVNDIPSYFWKSPIRLNGHLPILPKPRRALLYDLLDLHHSHLCKTKDFHVHIDDATCICRFCNYPATSYHALSCERLHSLSPCSRLHMTFSKEAPRGQCH